jgi:LDH2 family malate/lactate/ureidoglycolate dehydrogenase
LLWYDLAGASAHGIASLPEWLERIALGRVDPRAEGRIQNEHAAALVLDGQNGVPPLVLARAAALASEKARDAGVALVRVTNLGPMGPATEIAAEVAIGPQIGWVMGPASAWSLALPAAEGLPAVYDASLTDAAPRASGAAMRALGGPWSLLATDSGWLVAALAVSALEPLATFHERVNAALRAPDGALPLLRREPWEKTRAEARERGLPLGESALAALKHWSERLGATLPVPLHG